MKLRHWMFRAAPAALLLIAVGVAWANPRFARESKSTCVTCHTGVAGGADLNDAGKAFKADPTKAPKSVDSDVTYVGSNKCKTCHLKQHKAWVETPHAKAMEVLRTADAKKNEEIATALGVKLEGPADKAEACISCHVVGHKLTGGYPDADSTKTANLSAVGCESCHGPGSKHVSAPKAEKKAAIGGAVGEAFCRDCHTDKMSPKFVYEEYKKKGVHTVPTE